VRAAEKRGAPKAVRRLFKDEGPDEAQLASWIEQAARLPGWNG
jgi:hypothetical protein